MAIGLYIHIPYCLQKCHYCDFATLPVNHSLDMSRYYDLLLLEIKSRHEFIDVREVSSIYFGGGTPSLFPPERILALRNELLGLGFKIVPNAEITIEINPGTIHRQALDLYLAAGVNRYSVGVQTFNDSYLKKIGREHSADSSRKTLQFLKDHSLNYSFDLMFGLPDQKMSDLKKDLNELGQYTPPHVSLYNLTIPKKNPLNTGRASDDVQAEMFKEIELSLSEFGLYRYELSNFCLMGSESKHNQIYWSDLPYWGIGLSAHSYLPKHGPWGTRFWNPSSAQKYEEQVLALQSHKNFLQALPSNQLESLEEHQSLTDFCHTHLRMQRGLSLPKLTHKFGPAVSDLVQNKLERLVRANSLVSNENNYRIAPSAWSTANKVFLELTFLKKDLLSTH